MEQKSIIAKTNDNEIIRYDYSENQDGSIHVYSLSGNIPKGYWDCLETAIDCIEKNNNKVISY
jgi:hypothetical protein